ncbi:MAG: coproporphyrinogen dehydrogenase HemZ [Clostridia bacterium]|nr:coproporphyrinogen dehydrogenase HemZ [Clostridia bacterium]
MRFYLIGHERINPILQLLICLYPDEEHAQGDPAEGFEGEYVISELRAGEGHLVAEARDYRGNVHTVDCPAGMTAEDPAMNEYVRRAMYHLLLPMLEEPPVWGMLTGVKPAKLVRNLLARGMTPAEASESLRADYYVSDKRTRLAVRAGAVSQDYKNKIGTKDIDLYIGIPFCPAKCSYCSFVSNDVRSWGHMVEPYVQALLREVEGMGRVLGQTGREIRSIYIGGGTPSILSEDQLARLLDGIHGHFDLSHLEEFTLEAGRPETITAEKLRIAQQGGVGRISINPQTMNEEVLRGVGRLHSAQDIIDCYRMAREVGDFQINMDLIAGLPGDDDHSLISSVEQVVALDPDNVTLHCMARKRGAPLRFGKTGTLAAETVDRCHEIIGSHGYVPYYLYRQKYIAGGLENVGFAKPGTECRYNVVMMEEIGDVAALGSGGVTKLVYPDGHIERITNPKYPIEYIQGPEKIDQSLSKLLKALENH